MEGSFTSMTHSCSPNRHDRVHTPHHWRVWDKRERGVGGCCRSEAAALWVQRTRPSGTVAQQSLKIVQLPPKGSMSVFMSVRRGKVYVKSCPSNVARRIISTAHTPPLWINGTCRIFPSSCGLRTDSSCRS